MTPLSVDLTREQIVAELHKLDLDWGDEEDAESLLSILSERFTPTQAWTWLMWGQLALLREGRSREVFARAREMVAG